MVLTFHYSTLSKKRIKGMLMSVFLNIEKVKGATGGIKNLLARPEAQKRLTNQVAPFFNLLVPREYFPSLAFYLPFRRLS